MKAVISNTDSKSKRIKIKIPYKAVEWRTQIKNIQGVWYHPEQKLWSVPNIPTNIDSLKTILGDAYTIVKKDGKIKMPSFEMTSHIAKQVEAMMTKLILSGMSKSTVSAYRSNILHFFKEFENVEIKSLTKEEIEAYIYRLKSKNSISNTKQNIIINAIKFYLEKVLGLPRTVYNLTRPKPHKTLPDALSEEDAYKILNALPNLKHRAMLNLLYSAGLRRGEITKLRIEDIKSHDMQIFIKGGKGKKDRTTMLAEHTLELLREYYVAYKPSYWLFEGQSGGRYSTSSINKVFRKAAKATNIAQWATPHTLRHSFATHLLMANVNLRYIQSCLGHASSETTEIYTHIVNINNNNVRSPLDRLMDKRNKK